MPRAAGESAIAVLREVAARLRREDRQHVRAGYRPWLHLTTQGWRIVALCVGVLRCRWILKCSQATTNNDLDQWHPGLYRAPVKIFFTVLRGLGTCVACWSFFLRRAC